MNEIIIAAIVSIFTGVIGFLTGNRKRIAEARAIEIESTQKAIQIWRETAERLHSEIKLTVTEIQKLKEGQSVLKAENESLKKEIKTLRLKVMQLSKNEKCKS